MVGDLHGSERARPLQEVIRLQLVITDLLAVARRLQPGGRVDGDDALDAGQHLIDRDGGVGVLTGRAGFCGGRQAGGKCGERIAPRPDDVIHPRQLGVLGGERLVGAAGALLS